MSGDVICFISHPEQYAVQRVAQLFKPSFIVWKDRKKRLFVKVCCNVEVKKILAVLRLGCSSAARFQLFEQGRLIRITSSGMNPLQTAQLLLTFYGDFSEENAALFPQL